MRPVLQSYLILSGGQLIKIFMLTSKDFRVFKNICTWANKYCPSANKDIGNTMGVVKSEETPEILEAETDVL